MPESSSWDTIPAEDYVLARPDIAEALEQIHLDRLAAQSGDSGAAVLDQPEHITPVDVELALDGLAWISEYGQQRTGIRKAAAKSEGKLIGLQADARRQAEMEADRAFRAEGDRQVEAVIEHVTEAHPHLNPHGFFKLVGTLHSQETEEGVHVNPYKGYPLTISEQVLSFLDDPRKLINDVSVARHALEFFADAKHRLDYPIAAAYAERIGTDLGGVLLHGEYKDLPASVIDQWFSALDSAKEPKMAADIIEKSAVLQRTLLRTAHRDPIQFIDRLHALGMRGLRPGEDLANTMTVEIISQILQSDPMAACSLVQGSYFVEEPRKAGMQQRAMDLVISLDELLGVHMASYYSHDRYNFELDRKDRRRLERHLVPRLHGGQPDMKVWEARTPQQAEKTRAEFVAKAGMQEGKDTIYGRIVHYKRRNSLLGRLLRRGNRE